MSDYTAAARSNFFRVKDPKRFKRWCAFYGLVAWTKANTPKGAEDYFAIAKDDGDGWPSTHPETHEDIDFAVLLREHLQPTDVAVLLQSGHVPGCSSVGGYAVAIHPDGRSAYIGLSQIFDIARKTFGDAVTITAADY